MKKALKIFLGVAMLAVVALSCVACSVGTWVDQMVCDHEFDDGVVTKESTCAEFGELTKTCSICGKTEVENIDKKDHTVILIEEVAPTCVKTGLTSGTKCSVCDIVITEPQEVPAMGHKVVKDDAISATCLTSGLTEGSHCGRCNEVLNKQTVVPAHGHKLVSHEQVDSTCLEKGHSAYSECTVCKVKYGYEEFPLLEGHDFSNGLCEECYDLSKYTKRELKEGDTFNPCGNILYFYESGITFADESGNSFLIVPNEVCNYFGKNEFAEVALDALVEDIVLLSSDSHIALFVAEDGKELVSSEIRENSGIPDGLIVLDKNTSYTVDSFAKFNDSGLVYLYELKK